MAKESGESMTGSGAMKGVGASDETAAIRGDIERTRGDMASTVNAIEERLSPAHIKEQFANVTAGVTSDIEHKVAELKDSIVGGYHETKDHVKDDLGRELRGAKHMVADEFSHARAAVRDATVGRVEHMVHDARESVSDAGNSILDTVRANPIPAAFIGIGIGWLLFGGKKGPATRHRPRGGYRDEPSRLSDGYGGSPYGMASRSSPDSGRSGQPIGQAMHAIGDRVAGAGHQVKEGASHLVDDAQGALHDAGAAMTHFAQDAGSSLAHAAHDARDGAAHMADEAWTRGRSMARGAGRQIMRVERGAESVFKENPLALGAVALAVGAAIGMSLPSTHVEDEWMGDAKDRFFRQAENLAGDAVHKAESAVGQLTAGDGPISNGENQDKTKRSSEKDGPSSHA